MTKLPDPEHMGHILMLAMEEVLGREGLRAVLDTAGGCGDARNPQGGESSPVAHTGSEPGEGHPAALFPAMNHILSSLEKVYGPQAGQGIAQRVGRACFPYGLRQYGGLLGLTQTSFRLLPFPQKLKTMSLAFADLLHGYTDQHVYFEKSGGKLFWHMEGCPLCRQRHTVEPACHLAVGLAEESLYWLSGGKIFQVDEIACTARGDPRCTLQIDESPLS